VKYDQLEIDATSVAANTAGFANDVNTTAGLPLTLAANVPGDDLAHKAILTPSASVTGSYALTGLGPTGEVQTETLATNTTNAVTSTKYWSRLNEVLAPAGIAAATIDIGWTADSLTTWKYPKGYPLGIGCTKVSGSPNYSLQYTYDGEGIFTHATITGKTADFDGSITTPVKGIRLLFTAAGRVRLTAFSQQNYQR
jgi:hypothetical protein